MTLMDQEVVGQHVERHTTLVHLKQTRRLVPSVARETFVTPMAQSNSNLHSSRNGSGGTHHVTRLLIITYGSYAL